MDYLGVGLFVDPSGKGQDETAWAVVASMHGMYYVLDFGGFQGGGYDDVVLEELALLARRYKVNLVVAEDNFGNGMFTKLLTPVILKIYQCGIEEVRVNTRKEMRIITTLEPVMNQHRLVIDKSALERDYRKLRDASGTVGDSWRTYSLTYQMSRMTKEKNAIPHDDRLEAISMGVSWWADQACLDVEQSVLKEQRRLDQQFTDASLMSILGNKKKPPVNQTANRGLQVGYRGSPKWKR